MAETEPANVSETVQKTLFISSDANGMLAELVTAEPQWTKPTQSRVVEALIRKAHEELNKANS